MSDESFLPPPADNGEPRESAPKVSDSEHKGQTSSSGGQADAAARASALGQADGLVQQLRDRAQAAVTASMQYAELSHQYMELSQQLAALAEKADRLPLPELQQSFRDLERRTPVVDVPPSLSQAGPQRQPDLTAIADQQTPSPRPASVDAATLIAAGDSRPTDLPTDAPAGDKLSAAAPTAAAKRSRHAPRRRKRIVTRRFVERARATGLAVRGRVRVKAKKADLAPRVRTASDEITNHKGSIAASVCLLSAAIFILSLVTLQLESEQPLDPIIAGFTEPREDVVPVEPLPEEGEQLEADVEEPIEEPIEEEPEAPEEEPEPEPESAAAPEPEPEMAEPAADPAPTTAATSEMADTTNTAASAAVPADHRSAAGRQVLLRKYGGSVASEAAVQKALQWLVSVQHPQGYWDFVNVGPSGNAGTINNPIGGTAYAVLPFLAAGQTHQSGEYQQQVGRALEYLTRIGVQAPAGYDLRGMINKNSDDDEPNEAYYVHGAATLALCEAYGMTKDRRLRRPAEGAVRFIVNSQDPRGGGWRYNPQEAGSTSVTVIQLMALMSAQKAGLKVPPATLDGVRHYLDSVQVDQAGRYGYEIQKKRYTGAVTSMALLSRMYLGWGRDDGDMRAGIALLDRAGPYDNIYSLYFATQVMKNWGGAEWDRWNNRMRDDLVAMQETEGPAAGSWKPRTGAISARQGGRLLTTALAALTLEVYYRYQPLLPPPEPLSGPAERREPGD